MLSGLRKKAQQNSSIDSKASMESQAVPPENSWVETPDDVVTAGSEQWMSHQDRQSLVKNRTYSVTEPAKPSQRP
jgi:hypothetical protein